MLDDRIRNRKLLLLCSQAKAAHIFDYQKRMRIDGIDMKQIKLALPDDFPKGRYITSEYAVAFHAFEL